MASELPTTFDWPFFFARMDINYKHVDRANCYAYLATQEQQGLQLPQNQQTPHYVFRYCSNSEHFFQRIGEACRIDEPDVVHHNGELRLIACTTRDGGQYTDFLLVPLREKFILVWTAVDRITASEFTNFHDFEMFLWNDLEHGFDRTTHRPAKYHM